MLALYTAGGGPPGVALVTERGEHSRELPVAGAFEHLLAVARDLLNEAGLGTADLDGVAIARGPGSFTGLRVAASVALGLCRAAELPLYGVGTLEIWAALALGGLETGTPCRVVLDARRGELYVADFRALGPQAAAPRAEGGPRVIAAVEALADLAPEALVVGDGRELLVATGLDPRHPGFPRPPELLALSLARLVRLDPVGRAVPLEAFALEYVREPQAAAGRR